MPLKPGTISPWWVGRFGVACEEKPKRWLWVILMHQSFLTMEAVQGLQILEPCELKESNGEEIPWMMQRYKWAGPWTFPVCCLLSINWWAGRIDSLSYCVSFLQVILPSLSSPTQVTLSLVLSWATDFSSFFQLILQSNVIWWHILLKRMFK